MRAEALQMCLPLRNDNAQIKCTSAAAGRNSRPGRATGGHPVQVLLVFEKCELLRAAVQTYPEDFICLAVSLVGSSVRVSQEKDMVP